MHHPKIRRPKIIVSIPLGMLCIDTISHYKCPFHYSYELEQDHIDGLFYLNNCSFYKQEWMTDNKPCKLFDCYMHFQRNTNYNEYGKEI